jgi:hypothetical protein
VRQPAQWAWTNRWLPLPGRGNIRGPAAHVFFLERPFPAGTLDRQRGAYVHFPFTGLCQSTIDDHLEPRMKSPQMMATSAFNRRRPSKLMQ